MGMLSAKLQMFMESLLSLILLAGSAARGQCTPSRNSALPPILLSSMFGKPKVYKDNQTCKQENLACASAVA